MVIMLKLRELSTLQEISLFASKPELTKLNCFQKGPLPKTYIVRY